MLDPAPDAGLQTQQAGRVSVCFLGWPGCWISFRKDTATGLRLIVYRIYCEWFWTAYVLSKQTEQNIKS